MAHVNELSADMTHSTLFEDLRNYELSTDSRCSCCPYGFHVDNSFVNFTDTMKGDKSSRYNTIQGVHRGRSTHSQASQPPDLILHHGGDSSSVTGVESDRDNFTLFGTRTERRKKKQNKREKSSSIERPSMELQREYLDIYGADEIPPDSVFMSDSFDKQQNSVIEQYSTVSRKSEDVSQSVHSGSTDAHMCKHLVCPACNGSAIAACICPHQQVCYHQDSSYIDCCSDICCEDHTCHNFSCVSTSLDESPKHELSHYLSTEGNDIVAEESVETIKIEFDPEKVNEIRQYLIKCVNRIHELESQLRSLPVIQVRNSALREENTLLQDRVENQKLIIEQLNTKLKEKTKSVEDMRKLYNAGIQTEPAEDETRIMSKVTKPRTVDKGSNPIHKQLYSTTKIVQTIREPDVTMEEARETRIRRNMTAQIPRRRLKDFDDPFGEDGRTSKSIGVGDHDIKEFYTLDPNGWKIQDIPEAFYRRLRGNWVASLPKPRVMSIGVNNVPDYRHKHIDAIALMKNTSVGDHDVNSLYYLQPELASEAELPDCFVRDLRQRFESEYKPKVTLSSIGVSAVEATRSQMVETELLTDTIGVGNRDISTLYYLQPQLLRTEDLPIEAVRQLYSQWNSQLPPKPQTSTAGMQWDLETCEQALETDSPSLSSIGVGEHDVSRFYLLEYQPFDCEAELPPEILVYLKEKWHHIWEKSLPPKQHLVSTSTTFSRTLFNQYASTDDLIKTYSIGTGDHDVTKIYFLQSDIACIERELPRQYVQQLENSLKDSWIQSIPPKPELVNRVVEYRRQCQDKSTATEKQMRRNTGSGDNDIEKIYFLSENTANEHDLPSDFLKKMKDEWMNAYEKKIPVRPRLISRAVLCTPNPVVRLNVGTMSEDPQPAMFDEGVDVDLDDEEWAALDEKTWGEGMLSSVVGGTNLRTVIERLRHSYRFKKPEFVGLLSKMFARQVRTKSVQVAPILAETSTVFGDLNSSLITRGVGEHSINEPFISSEIVSSVGVQHRSAAINKYSNTDTPASINKASNTEKRLREQAVTYNKQNQISNKGVNTETSKTRSVVVWANLEQSDDEYDSDEDRFIKETWEELSIFDARGNVIRTERLPTYTVAHKYTDKGTSHTTNSLPTREEGGRYEHYYVNHGDSKSSSIAGDHSMGGGSSVNMPIFTGTSESPGAKSRDVTSKPSMDFVPRSPTENHPHVHVYGNDPATRKVNAWQIRGQNFQDWPLSDGSGDFQAVEKTTEPDSCYGFSVTATESVDESLGSSDCWTSEGVDRIKLSPGNQHVGSHGQSITSNIGNHSPTSVTNAAQGGHRRTLSPHSDAGNRTRSRSPQSTAVNRGFRNTNTNPQNTKSSNNQSNQIRREIEVSTNSQKLSNSRITSNVDTVTSAGQKTASSFENRSKSANNNEMQRRAGNTGSVHLNSQVRGDSRTQQASAMNRGSGTTSTNYHQTKVLEQEPSQMTLDGDSSANKQKQDGGFSVNSQSQQRESVSLRSQNSSMNRRPTDMEKYETVIGHGFDQDLQDAQRLQNFSRSENLSKSRDSDVTQQVRRNVNIPVNVPVDWNSDAEVSMQQEDLSEATDDIQMRTPAGHKLESDLNVSGMRYHRPESNLPNRGNQSDFETMSGDKNSDLDSQFSDFNSPWNQSTRSQDRSSHHTYSQKSSRVISSKTVVTTSSGLSSSGKDTTLPPPIHIESDELRPLFSTTWSSPEYPSSQTHTSSSVMSSSSHMIAKDGQIVEQSSSTERSTTGGDSFASQGPGKQASAVDVHALPKQNNESDDDSVFLRPSPPGSASHQGSRRTFGRHQSGSVISGVVAISKDDECFDYGGGVVQSQSLSTPSSPRLPRSIMKRNVDANSEKQYNTLPLLKKKKGIRFSNDTKSDGIGSGSFSVDEINKHEETPFELEFMRRLERLREERNLPDGSALQKFNFSPKMRESFLLISNWMDDSTKFNNKQLNEAISNLRREWFIVSAGREADGNRVRNVLDVMQQFSPSLLELIVNLPDDNSNTSLHYAVSREQWDIVARLLDTNRVRISRANKAGYTPLMLTALCREVHEVHRPVIQRLLASGHINQGSNVAGQTALMLAASHGRTDMVHLLLESGADPNKRDKEGSTALMCASEHGHLEAAKVLLASSHCDPNMKDNDGSTALSIALENKHRDIALLIYSRSNLKDGANSNLKKS